MIFGKRKNHYRNMTLESQPVACKTAIFRLELLHTEDSYFKCYLPGFYPRDMGEFFSVVID